MMRSLYSGVAGLKTHQTKMDVIGNNIANVNTVGFKSSSVNFADTFYQTVSGASGANADLGTAGTNAKQIGLGSLVAAIQVNITEQGGPSTTNRALDVAINGESFLIVRSGSETLFTKSGALNVDEDGTLYCTTNGATVQGWLADDDGNILKDTVKDLRVMSEENMYYEPEATTAVTMTGNVDPNDPDVAVTYDNTGIPVSGGEVLTFSFYDRIGEQYSVKMQVTKNPTQTQGTVKYDVRIADVLNSDGESIFVIKTIDQNTKAVTYGPSGASIMFGSETLTATDDFTINERTGEVTAKPSAVTKMQKLVFNSASGEFGTVTDSTDTERTNPEYAGKAINFSVIGPVPVHSGEEIINGTNSAGSSTFPQYVNEDTSGAINIYFDALTQYSQGGTSKLSSYKGYDDGSGVKKVGNTAGTMKGLAIDQEGKVWGTYNNGLKKCLGQIAVTTFANPSGLESRGDSLFAASLNSGEFDGIGEEITISGSFTVGALEMSNVDLANEFTNMITTQRGFQANSRIITTSDSMLEELVNLKR